ncbi:Calx-beta domain-containing protein, partial [Chitinophaga sp. GCM10012297]
MLLILMMLSNMVNAQAPSRVINPTGGETPTDGLRITITDTSVMVRRNGVDQFSLDPLLDRYDRGGLRTYVILERKLGGTIENKEPKYLQACNISDVVGDGSAGNPWRVVTQTKFKNGNNADYNLSTEYVYTAGTSYYLINYYLSSNEGIPSGSTGGPYWINFYLSEASWMDGATCGKGFKDLEVDATLNPWWGTSGTGYIPRMVGITKSGSDCDGLSGTHVFKTVPEGFISYYAGPVAYRNDKLSNGYTLTDMIKAVPDNSGITVHTAVDVNGVFPGNLAHATRQMAVGFDAAEMQSLYMMDPNLEDATSSMPMEVAQVTLTPVTSPAGLEGDAAHTISGLQLNLANATFNLPQVLEIQVTPSGTHPAVEGTDYRVLQNKIIIPPGTYVNDQLELPIEIIGNTTPSTVDKTFTVTLVAPTCAPHLQLGAVSSLEYTIVDDDQNRIFIEPEKTSLKEGEKTKIKVKMTGAALPTDLTVDINRLVASTTKTSDYSGLLPQVTILANEHETEFELTATGDLILEGDESLQIGATATIGGEAVGDTTEIIITDTTHLNPDNKIITFSSPKAAEGTPVTITASLPSGVTTEAPLAINIDYTNPASTADFSDISGATPFPSVLTIPADGSQVTYNINLVEDYTLEETEFWYFDGTATDSYGAYTMVSSYLEIEDSPAGRTLTISFGGTTSVTESPLTVQVVNGTISFDPSYSSASDIIVNLVLDGTSTADAGDFVTMPLQVTIPAGYSSANFTLQVPADQWILEADETAVVTGNLSGFTFADGSFVIKDRASMTSGNKKVIFDPSTATNLTEGNSLPLRIRFGNTSVRSQEPIVITLSAGPSTTGSVTTADYNMPATVTIQPGDNGVDFTLDALTDVITETESIQVLANTNILGTLSTPSRTVNLLDAVSNKIIFTATPTTLDEGGAGITVTATLESGTAPADISITVQTGSGSSASDADYTITTSPAVIAAGASSATFTISAPEDGVLERAETLNLTGTATGYTFDGLTFTINDATSANPLNRQISVVPDATSVNEGSGVRVVVKLPDGITTSEEITITLAQGAGSDAGIQGGDYSYALPVKIPVGAGETDFMLQAASDNIFEPTEKLELSASATVFDDPVTATVGVNITDGSKTPANTLLVVTGPSTVTEGNMVKYRIALPSGVTTTEDIVITLAPVAGTTTASGDFNGNYPLSATISAGTTFEEIEFDAKSDGVVEGLEHLNMQFQATGFTFTGDVSLDVEDTDPAGLMIQLSANPATVAEGAATEITASLQGFTSASDIDVVLSSGSGSTAGSGDHGVLGTIHIAAGQSSAKVNISAVADDILEGNEMLELRGSTGGFTVQGTDITITDATNTNANKTIMLTPATATVAEGGVVKIKAILPTGITSTQDITVTLTKAAGSAATLDVADVTFPGSVTILAGTNEIEFDVTANMDNLIEVSELLK